MMQQISVRGWRTAEPEFTEIRLEKPRAIKKMLEAAFGLDARSEKIAEEMNLSVEFLNDVLAEFALAPNSQPEQAVPPTRGNVVSSTGNSGGCPEPRGSVRAGVGVGYGIHGYAARRL
jgi:hypothetical protein